MKPILWQGGGLVVPSYTVLLALGVLLFLGLTLWSPGLRGLPRRPVTLSLVVAYLAGLAGARLFFVLEHVTFLDRPFETLLSPNPTGFSAFGAAATAASAVLLVARYARLPLGRLADSAVPGLCALVVLGRTGCFLAGCCFGRPTGLPWGVVFPAGSEVAVRFGASTAVHPTQLYEAALIGLLGWIVLRPSRLPEAWRSTPGVLFLSALTGYASIRFLEGFLRGDVRVQAGGLGVAQWFSLATGIAGFIGLWVLLGRYGSESPAPMQSSGGGRTAGADSTRYQKLGSAPATSRGVPTSKEMTVSAQKDDYYVFDHSSFPGSVCERALLSCCGPDNLRVTDARGAENR